jgi:diguanylate cyclase (GGDEF)-like protein
MRREKILTIDDDSDILDVLAITLSDNYDVISAPNGKEGLDMVRAKNPDLIITDYNMPVMNGPDFCKELRKDILFRHIPIIMLTGKGEVKDMVLGIESGADDYLVKPFEPDTLLARIRMILRRTIMSLDANPLTRLPGNTSIMDELQQEISSGRPFAVGYADLDKFKIYNDKYGFEKGDEVIRATARIIVENANRIAGKHAFVGHIGGDDFVFICADDLANRLSEAIIDEFDKTAPNFYNETDRTAGYIIGKDRQGGETKAGLMSISIGIVSSVTQKISHVAQVGEIGADLKKYAKGFEKSNYVRDQRKS